MRGVLKSFIWISGAQYVTTTGAYSMPLLSAVSWATPRQSMLLWMQHSGQGEARSGLTKWLALAKRPTSVSATITDLLTVTAFMLMMLAQSVQVRGMNALCTRSVTTLILTVHAYNAHNNNYIIPLELYPLLCNIAANQQYITISTFAGGLIRCLFQDSLAR